MKSNRPGSSGIANATAVAVAAAATAPPTRAHTHHRWYQADREALAETVRSHTSVGTPYLLGLD